MPTAIERARTKMQMSISKRTANSDDTHETMLQQNNHF